MLVRRHGGIIRDDGKDPRHFAFLVFKGTIKPPTRPFVSGQRGTESRLSGREPYRSFTPCQRTGCSVAYYKVKAGEFTDACTYDIHARVLVIRTKARAYRGVTNPDTTTRTSASLVARKQGTLVQCMMQRPASITLYTFK